MTCRRTQTSRKRRTKQRKKQEEQHKIRSDVERILAAMGLHDQIKITRMPDEYLHWLRRPKPTVLPAPDQAHDPRLSQLARQLKRKLDRVTVTVRGIDVSFNDYWSIGLPVANCLIWGSSAGSIKKTGFSSKVLRHASEFRDLLGDEFFYKYRYKTMEFLADHSSFDESLYSARQISSSEERPNLGTILSKHTPEMASIVEEGVRRRAYRCGAPENLDTGGITWVSWEPEPLGWGKGPPLPVFIQTHAIEQTLRRLLPDGHGNCLQYLMWDSLRTPRLTPLDDRGFLVDMVVNGGKRVGYLVGSRLPDCVLIRTFLLPMMQGTPEARNLYRLLKLRRPDIEYLGLDNLWTLATTDLFRDAEIVRIFEECGCRDLVRFVTEDWGGDVRYGQAELFKQFFGLSTSGRFSPPHPTIKPWPTS